MNIGKAAAICERLDSEEYSIEDKLLAVHEAMNMPTHMGIKKDTLIVMIKWLWNLNLEISESHNGKRIVEIMIPHGRLIDADKIYDLVEQRYRMSSGIEHRCERDLLDLICSTETILDAEGEE